MSGPKANSVRVVSAAEMRRREDERRKRNCSNLLNNIEKVNNKLLSDLRLEVKDSYSDSHEDLIKKEDYLNNLKDKVNKNLQKQKEAQVRCELLSTQIDQKRQHLTNPSDFAPIKQKITNFADYKIWEEKLNNILDKIEIQSEKDAVLLKYKTKKNLDLNKVEISNNKVKQLRQNRINERRKKLDRIAERICSIEDDKTRETLVLKTTPLLDLESDEDFDDAIINLNTDVRDEIKAQKRKSEAIELVSQVMHLESREVNDLQLKAKNVRTTEDVRNIRVAVDSLLEDEKNKLDKIYINNALQETLIELGYELGDGFEQTEYGPVAIAQKASYSNHALRVQLSKDAKEIYTRVVSISETTPEQDVQAEELMCDDCHAIRKVLNEKGCEAKLISAKAPGEVKVQNLEQKRKNRARRARAKRRHSTMSKGRTV